MPEKFISELEKWRETSFILACLRSKKDNPPPPGLGGDDMDWNYVFHLLEAHGLIPFLYLKLKDSSISGIPERFLTAARDYFHANELRNRMLREELLKLLEALAQAGIDAIPLKGIVYAHTLYASPAARQFGDIDLLLHDSDISKAKEILEHHDYHAVYEQKVLAEGNSELTPAQQSVYRSVYHEYELQSRDGLIHIDLHWRLLPRMYPTNLPVNLIWRNLATAKISDLPIKTMSPELDLVYLCIHGAKDGWSELKWAADISELISTRNELDWERVGELSRTLYCRKILWTGLCLANWVTGVSIPKDMVPRIATSRRLGKTIEKLQRRLLTQPDRKFRRVPGLGINKTYLQLCDRRIDQLTYIFRMLTYTQARDWNVFGFRDQPPKLWPWIRPFRVLAYCAHKAWLKKTEF